MEPFTQDNAAFAFQKPLHPKGAATPGGSSIRPFTAVDLAPTAASNASKPMAPAVSPFLESFSSPFLASSSSGPRTPGESAQGAAGLMPSPVLEPEPRPGLLGAEPDQFEDLMPVLPSRPQAAPASTLPPAPTLPLSPMPAPFKPAPQPAPEAALQAVEALPPLPAAAHPSQIMAMGDRDAAASSSARPRFFITSTASVDGFPIQSYLEVLSVEVVLPKDLLFRNPAPYGELHRLKAAEDQLQKVKAKALEELTAKGRQIHADGIVGLQINFVNLDTVCCLCSVVGTAVKIV